MANPRSVRFDPAVAERLTSFVSRHPGSTGSSVAARLVDEGLRMDEFPGVIFRQGPAGRRATLIGGPDVWEVIRAVQSARRAEPTLSEREVVELVAENGGLPVRLVRVAIDYWSTYPHEVDALIAHAERVEKDRQTASRRTTDLLAP